MAVKVTVNTKAIENKIDRVLHDETFMYHVHESFKTYCNDYVPARSTAMAQSVEIDTKAKPQSENEVFNLNDRVEITKDYVHYLQPYAHYQYTGELYLAANGSSWAKKGEKKYPSGLPLNYSKQVHPKASKKWDKAMMADKGEQFMKQIRELFKWRAKQLYG